MKQEQSLKLIEDAATGIDSLLQNSVREVIAGHQYSNIGIKGQAHTGDAYSSDWSRGAVGASHIYDSVKVEEGGKGSGREQVWWEGTSGINNRINNASQIFREKAPQLPR